MATNDRPTNAFDPIVDRVRREIQSCDPIFLDWLVRNDYLPSADSVEADTLNIVIGVISRDALVMDKYYQSRTKQILSSRYG